MQDALDPTIGQTEIVAMKKEIHRMELRYEQLRKKQEEMIKDMERSVFKRETIQLKYLPKVEKKNAQDKSTQGKLSRQIANLRQTLRHTTDNTMQLDGSIDQRLKELEDVNRDIQQYRDVSEQEEAMTQRNYYELLASKMDKAKTLYETDALQTQSLAYRRIATGQFRSQFGSVDQANQFLDQSKGKNQMIEEILDKIRNQNPDLDVILNKCLGW